MFFLSQKCAAGDQERDHRPITLTYSPLPLPSNLDKNVKNGQNVQVIVNNPF